MQTRTLGKDLEVSSLGYGCMGLTHAYGQPLSNDDAIKVIQNAYECGYTFFDTAECYTAANADGKTIYNERIVGKALAPFKGKVKIATKFGIFRQGTKLFCDSHPDHIREALEGSLKRLGVECIDIYYQHRIDEFVSPEEVAYTMAALIKEGKIAHWGISEANADYIKRANKVCPVTAIQNRYSMMYRDYEKLFPVLEELNIGFVAFSPLANGFLTAQYDRRSTFDNKFDYRSNMPQFQKDAYEKNELLLSLLRGTAKQHNATPAQISLAWMLAKKPYIVPIPGSRNIDRLRENAGAAEIILSKEEVNNLDKALSAIPMSEVFGGHKY